MNNIFVLVRKDLLEQWRTKKILILVIVFLFVAMASPIIAKLLPELLKNVSVPGMTIKLPDSTYVDSLDQFIKNTSQIALLVLVFAVAGAISDEKSNKTLEMLLTKPITRTKYIISKFISYFVSISAIFIAASLIFYFYTVSTFAPFNFSHFALMAGNVLSYILMIAAITILASTIASSTLTAVGIGFVGYIFFGVIFNLIDGIKQYSPNLIFSNYQTVVSRGWNSDLNGPIILTLALIIFSVALAIILFRRQEIER